MMAFMKTEQIQNLITFNADVRAYWQARIYASRFIERDSKVEFWWLPIRLANDQPVRSILSFNLMTSCIRPNTVKSKSISAGKKWEAKNDAITLVSSGHISRQTLRVCYSDSKTSRQTIRGNSIAFAMNARTAQMRSQNGFTEPDTKSQGGGPTIGRSAKTLHGQDPPTN